MTEESKMEIPFSTLAGLVLERFEVGREDIRIIASKRAFVVNHQQDCCESVVVESVSGDPVKSFGETIIDATEHTNRDSGRCEHDESFTWTYYTIRTQSQTIVIRWYGASNGYYSESVSFWEENK